jgi:flagellar basal body-associated protein FliL
MNKKKLILIIIGFLLLSGGGVGGYLYFYTPEKDTKTTENEKEEKVWNPYSEEHKKIVTLNDFLISADKGNYVVKMTVDLELKNEDALKKYSGLANKEEELVEAKEGAALTPMEIQMNSLVGTFIFNANEEILKNKEQLEFQLKEYLNAKLGAEKDFIKDLYIENYVLQ